MGRRYHSRIKTLGIIFPAGTYITSFSKNNLRATAAMETNGAGVTYSGYEAPLPGGQDKERLQSGRVNGPRLFFHGLKRRHSPSASIRPQDRGCSSLPFEWLPTLLCHHQGPSLLLGDPKVWCSGHKSRVDVFLCASAAVGKGGNLEFSLSTSQPTFSVLFIPSRWMKLLFMVFHEERIGCNCGRQWHMLVGPAIAIVRSYGVGFRSCLSGKKTHHPLPQFPKTVKWRWLCLLCKGVAKIEIVYVNVV